MHFVYSRNFSYTSPTILLHARFLSWEGARHDEQNYVPHLNSKSRKSSLFKRLTLPAAAPELVDAKKKKSHLEMSCSCPSICIDDPGILNPDLYSHFYDRFFEESLPQTAADKVYYLETCWAVIAACLSIRIFEEVMILPSL